jgi:hypothetical protein
MLQFNLTINTTNAAFDIDPHAECARILREISDRMESNGIPPVPRDINGNRCGSVEIINEEDAPERTEAEETRRGELLAEVLELRRKANGRVDTAWGDKTPLGLFKTVSRIINKGE